MTLRSSKMAFVLALFLLTGCGRAINRSAERRIRDALPDLLGPAKQYRVHVANPPERTLEGRLANVMVDGDDVQLANGLLLDQLHLELRGVEIDSGKRRIRRIQEARFTTTVGAASLDEFLAGESPDEETIRRARVTLDDNNRVTITGQRVTLGVGVPFQLTGPVRLAGPQRIEIDPSRLVVVGIPVTGVVLRFLKSRFESAIDLSSLPFPVTLSAVETTRGKMTLSGTADVAAILQRAQEESRSR